MFFTGLRLSEGLALRWDTVDMTKKTVHVRRTIALGVVEERTKTGRDRFVLLDDRALHALEFAKRYAVRRRQGKGQFTESPFVFPPGKMANRPLTCTISGGRSSRAWGSDTAPRITAVTPMRQYA